jgi:hypothetical protein
MKKLLLLFCISFTLFCCNNDDVNCQGIDCLPPATQTGAGTFGCLINGEPFVDNSGFFNCFYQFVDGKYYFNITANFDNKIPKVISLATNALQIDFDSTYQLLDRNQGHFYAEVTFDNNPPLFLNDNTTNNLDTGVITINYFSLENNIISGTFNFKIRDTINNKIYNITEGRFDTLFTQ